MNLLNQLVLHKVFGEGKVIEHSTNNLTISFTVGNKRFIFPDSFEVFLKATSPELEAEIYEILVKQNADKELKKAETERNLVQMRTSFITKVGQPSLKSIKSSGRVQPRSNVAFKCNYCNGGQSDEQVGFNGACSDDMIHNNIIIEHRTWCNSEDCPCLHYHNGEMNREELDDICASGGFVCYESQMLRDWKALAGIVQHGENKGEPMKLNQVQPNSLCVLTTRNPQSCEKDRYVFAVFLVDDTYEGDGSDEGFVSARSEFKMKLTPSEARVIRFWNYHANDNCPERAVWSSGLHRYLEDEHAAQILRDIVKIKAGTKDEALSKRFFEHFCELNFVDAEALPEPFGALKRV